MFNPSISFFESAPISSLEATIEALDPTLKEKLAIKNGAHNISFYRQLKNYYAGRRLAYENTPEAIEDLQGVFLIILEQNLLLVEQIGKYKEFAAKYVDLENWKTSTANLYISKNQSISDSSSGTMTNSLASGTVEVTGKNKASDSNSVGFNDDEYPINQFNTMDNDTKQKSDSSSGSVNVVDGRSSNAGFGGSITDSSNTSKDLREMIAYEYRGLRTRLLSKFDRLFFSR